MKLERTGTMEEEGEKMSSGEVEKFGVGYRSMSSFSLHLSSSVCTEYAITSVLN